MTSVRYPARNDFIEAWMSLEGGAEQHLMSYVGEVVRAMASQHPLALRCDGPSNRARSGMLLQTPVSCILSAGT